MGSTLPKEDPIAHSSFTPTIAELENDGGNDTMSKLNISPWKESFWLTLQTLAPSDVCARSSAIYHADGYYSLICMNGKIKIYPEAGVITDTAQDKASIPPEFELLLLSYLIKSKDIPVKGEWISEKDIPGGSMFFRGPHALPTHELEEVYGEDPGGFESRGKALDGKPGSFGDISMEFQVLPRIPVTIVLWIGDDEFPPRCHFLFDSTIRHHFPLDVVLALTNTMVSRFLG